MDFDWGDPRSRQLARPAPRAINGKSNETLDPAVIESDGVSARDSGSARRGRCCPPDPGYAELVRRMHAEFHRAAATVVRQVQGGRAEEARATLKQDVDRLSRCASWSGRSSARTLELRRAARCVLRQPLRAAEHEARRSCDAHFAHRVLGSPGSTRPSASPRASAWRTSSGHTRSRTASSAHASAEVRAREVGEQRERAARGRVQSSRLSFGEAIEDDARPRPPARLRLPVVVGTGLTVGRARHVEARVEAGGSRRPGSPSATAGRGSRGRGAGRARRGSLELACIAVQRRAEREQRVVGDRAAETEATAASSRASRHAAIPRAPLGSPSSGARGWSAVTRVAHSGAASLASSLPPVHMAPPRKRLFLLRSTAKTSRPSSPSRRTTRASRHPEERRRCVRDRDRASAPTFDARSRPWQAPRRSGSHAPRSVGAVSVGLTGADEGARDRTRPRRGTRRRRGRCSRRCDSRASSTCGRSRRRRGSRAHTSRSHTRRRWCTSRRGAACRSSVSGARRSSLGVVASRS